MNKGVVIEALKECRDKIQAVLSSPRSLPGDAAANIGMAESVEELNIDELLKNIQRMIDELER